MKNNKSILILFLVILFVMLTLTSVKANTLSYDTSELLTKKEWNDWKQSFHPKQYIDKKLEERIDLHYLRYIMATSSDVVNKNTRRK